MIVIIRFTVSSSLQNVGRKLRHPPSAAANRLIALRPAFTLSELLVVIAIVAILASLLLPALSRAKLKATNVACLNNQKQLSLGFISYAFDNNDTLIPLYGGNRGCAGGYWPGPLDNGGVLQDPLGAGISVEAAEHYVENGLKKGGLFPYVNSPATYHCPGDWRSNRLKPGHGWMYDSYSKANGMNGDIWALGDLQEPFEKLASVQDQSRAMVFVEEGSVYGDGAYGIGYQLGPWVLLWKPNPGWCDSFASFHGDVSTFSFADGHAESHTWRDPRVIKALRDNSAGIATFFWPGGNASNPDFRWIYERYRFRNWTPLQ